MGGCGGVFCSMASFGSNPRMDLIAIATATIPMGRRKTRATTTPTRAVAMGFTHPTPAPPVVSTHRIRTTAAEPLRPGVSE